MSSSSKHICTK